MKPRIRYFILVGLFVSFAFFSCKSAPPKDTGLTTSLADGAGMVQQEVTSPADEASFVALTQAVAQAKDKAIEAGAGELVPDRLAIADSTADKSRELYENGDIQGSINAGKEAQARYQILETLALARTKQEEADENNFFSVDPDNYILAAEAGNDAVDLYDKGELAKAQAEATTAYNGFREVIKNAWLEPVEEKTSMAREARTTAQDIKADVAARSDFAAAESVYNQAHVALRAEKYAEALELFEESDRLYEIAYNNALDKRRIAEEALRRADAKLAESEDFAQYVDDIIGGDE
ncbi:MAG: hypothetical protein FWG29_02175 [Treponema sp.]|nr:hypothetical protein [Treponema sp.]